MAGVFGPRPAAVVRELTKKFEELREGALPGLAAYYSEAGPPKGEIVIIIDRAPEKKASAEEIDALLRAALTASSVKDAAAEVAAATGAPRKTLYQRALALKEE